MTRESTLSLDSVKYEDFSVWQALIKVYKQYKEAFDILKDKKW